MQVVKAVAGAVPVLVDGGVRGGTDVFKALALGHRSHGKATTPGHSRWNRGKF